MKPDNRSDKLFEFEPEKIHHHWTASDRAAMDTARVYCDMLKKSLQENGNWQLWARELLKYRIPALQALLSIQGLTSGQRQEVQALLDEVRNSIPKQFKLLEEQKK